MQMTRPNISKIKNAIRNFSSMKQTSIRTNPKNNHLNNELIIYNKMFYIVNNFYDKLKILLYRDLTVYKT